ncbi:uncharacterized protein C45G9.9-like isoform X2 [Neocloeon triangulifer]|uniref:uncharacterized protein C45G9.9-like isoform X2 n=1 Tax=Neocloeon triangulifer TaxID=2078957 RepID=UPI00286F40BE|nr:uncharacterized protein C45G9.9-like isoform X2 [Neocloeon triangulifer]
MERIILLPIIQLFNLKLLILLTVQLSFTLCHLNLAPAQPPAFKFNPTSYATVFTGPAPTSRLIFHPRPQPDAHHTLWPPKQVPRQWPLHHPTAPPPVLVPHHPPPHLVVHHHHHIIHEKKIVRTVEPTLPKTPKPPRVASTSTSTSSSSTTSTTTTTSTTPRTPRVTSTTEAAQIIQRKSMVDKEEEEGSGDGPLSEEESRGSWEGRKSKNESSWSDEESDEFFHYGFRDFHLGHYKK